MRQTFIALVGAHLLAELVEDCEKLGALLKQIPNDKEWLEVRKVIIGEIRRRNASSCGEVPDAEYSAA